MAAVKRTKFQREADLVDITSLYLQGKNQREIAEILSGLREYSLTQQVISRDIHTILRRWREASEENIQQAKLRELAKINLLEATYWSAWENSLKAIEKQTTERSEGLSARNMAKLVKEETSGDPRFLQGVQWCIEQRVKILGLMAPPQLPVGEGGKAMSGAIIHIYQPDNGRVIKAETETPKEPQ